jgi:hypothetical protein
MSLDAKKFVQLDQTTTPSNPASAKHRIYFKSDGKMYQINNAGTEVEIGAGGGGEVVTGTGGILDMGERMTGSSIQDMGERV